MTATMKHPSTKQPTLKQPTASQPQSLEQLLSSAQIPALPTSAIRVLELSRREDAGPNDYARPIEADPGLAMQVLKFVNSSYFGFAREISSVRQGINLVGSRTVKNFVLWNAVFSLIPNPQCGPFDLRLLWQDSLRRAIFARLVGKQWRLPLPDDLFTAALLQDMAVPFLARALPQDYETLLVTRSADSVRLSSLEQERFGWTHGDAAARLAESWQLPAEFVNWMRNHAVLEQSSTSSRASAQVAVALSALLPSAADDHWLEREQLVVAYHHHRPAATPDLVAVLEHVDTEFAEFAPLLQIGQPGPSLVERFQATPLAACD